MLVMLWSALALGATVENVDSLSKFLWNIPNTGSVTRSYVGIGDAADKLKVRVHIQNTGSQHGLSVIAKDKPDRLVVLAKAMLKYHTNCGILADRTGSSWTVTTLGACGVDVSDGSVAAPPMLDVPVVTTVAGQEMAVWTGWAEDPLPVLLAARQQLGQRGTVVLDVAPKSSSAVVNALIMAAGFERDPIVQESAQSAVQAVGGAMAQYNASCGVVLTHELSQTAWRVFQVGDCPREGLHEVIDLKLASATGAERNELQAAADALLAVERQRVMAEREAARNAFSYVAPFPIDVSGMSLAPIAFREMLIDVEHNTYRLSPNAMRQISEKLLRSAGYQTVAPSAEPRFLITGTLVEYQPHQIDVWPGYAIGVDWRVVDTITSSTVYELRSRAWVTDAHAAGLGEEIVDVIFGRALASLLARERFVERLRVAGSTETLPVWAAPIQVQTCASSGAPLPNRASDSMQSVVRIRRVSATGSGVVLSSDGWLLTAAHVVGDEPEVAVEWQDGSSAQARVVRSNPDLDLAILHIDEVPAAGYPCTPPHSAPGLGGEVFVLGSPSGAEFSITRGVVSASFTEGVVTLLQTDAAVSPGNSGGPLLDASGRLVGIVTSKRVGAGIEGVGFAVSLTQALPILNVGFGTTSTANVNGFLNRWSSDWQGVEDESDPVPGE